MDWHDKDFQAWVAEVVGIEANVPLAHHHKQRYMSITLKNPSLQYPGPPKRRNVMNKDNRINVSDSNNSALTENALLGQYDREIQAIEAKKTKLKETIANLTETAKMLARKRSALARIIAPVGMILCLVLAGCDSQSSYFANEANIDCRDACERVGGRLSLIRVQERSHGSGFECECSFDQEHE